FDAKPIIFGPSDRVLTILAQTPAKDQAWREKTPRPKFVREWIDARYWAIVSANALEIAAAVQDVKGLPYRKAVRASAQAVRDCSLRPQLDELILDEVHAP